MELEMWVYLLGFMVFFLLTGVPIALALGLTVLTTVAFWGKIPFTIIFQQLYQGVDKFTLLAIPLFMLAGELMMESGIVDDIISLCNILVGRLRGGLAHANIVANMFFAGISGSAVADEAAIGSVLIPSMNKNGYDIDFAVGITAAAAVIGPIIPPSVPMVLYGSIMAVSIGGLFAGGMLPGILLGLGLMVVTAIISKKRNYPVSYKKYTARELAMILLKSIPALMMPIVILGGILGGVFTPTEAAAIANTYALLLGFFYYRTLTLQKVCNCLRASMMLAASVLFIVATAHPLGWLVAMAQIPQKIAMMIKTVTTNPLVILLLINIFLLMLGCVMEATANLLIFGPILAPVAAAVGIHPLHFGVVFVLNLMIGLITPPFGMCLFVGAGIGKISLERTMRAVLPFVVVEIIVLLMTSYITPLTLTMPRLFGFIK